MTGPDQATAPKKASSAPQGGGGGGGGTSRSSSLTSLPSFASIGIEASSSQRLKILHDGLASDDPLYDCVVLLIFCPAHMKIAVINTRREHIVWLPFMALREGLMWNAGATECVERTIGRQDAEMTAAEAAKLAPVYTTDYFEITQVQAPSVNFVTRICKLVTLKPSNYRCCTKTTQLDWMPLATLATACATGAQNSESAIQIGHGRQYSCHWGPELRQWAARLQDNLNKYKLPLGVNGTTHMLHDRTVAHALKFYGKEHLDSPEHHALLGLKFKVEHAVELYEDYLRHCYPSLYMNFESFRLYLTKYKFHRKSSKEGSVSKTARTEHEDAQPSLVADLFDLFRTKHTDYVDFHELLTGLVVLDPNCKDRCELRIRYLFRLYTRGGAHFTEADLRTLVGEMHRAATKEELAKYYASILKQCNIDEPGKLTFTILYKTLMQDHKGSRSVFNVTGLMRFKRSLLMKGSPSYGQRGVGTQKASGDKSKTKPIKDDFGELCWSCRPKNTEQSRQEFALHAAYLDTRGHCGDVRLLNKSWIEQSPRPEQRIYSLECTFSTFSIGQVCLDLVKAFARQVAGGGANAPSGILCAREDEQRSLTKYLTKLCHHVNGLLAAESKLVKLNSPALVYGDIQGSLADLLAIEEATFPSFPVQPETLVFLGNYTGEYPYGVECCMYLFALKVLSPSRVWLLRGNAETRVQSSGGGGGTAAAPDNHNLKSECFNKYGRQRGAAIFELLNDVFTKLPIAALLDEQVLCVHSGIPHSNKQLSALAKMTGTLFDVQKEAPMVYEMLTRYPLSYYHDGKTSQTVTHEFMGAHGEDLAFHSAPRAGSITSIDSASYSEKIRSGIRSDHEQLESDRSNKSSDHQNKSSTESLKSKTDTKSSSKSSVKSKKPKSADGKSVKAGQKMRSGDFTHKGKDKTKSKSKEGGSQKSGPSYKSKSKNKSADGSKHSLDSQRSKSKSKQSDSKKQSSAKSSEKLSNSNHSIKDKSTSSSSTAAHNAHKGYHPEPGSLETFDRKSFFDFMSLNHLEYMIRGSSLCKHGFKASFKGRCLSIFTCAKVRSYANEAACVLVANGALRFVALTPPKPLTPQHSSASSTLITAPNTPSQSAINNNQQQQPSKAKH